MNTLLIIGILTAIVSAGALVVLINSLHNIGESQVGLVTKHFGRKLEGSNILAFEGEAGYQAELLMPGWRFLPWPIYSVSKHPWVQVPAGEIGVVIAQVGQALPVGAKSALYKAEFGDFSNVRTFLDQGGQKGVQRPVLRPGSTVPLHPVAFLVLTKREIFGVPVLEEYRKGPSLTLASFKLAPQQLEVLRIEPVTENHKAIDICGVVTTLEGKGIPTNGIAGRLGGFVDISEMEAADRSNAEIIEALLHTKNELHDSYQDFQAFLDQGGCIGLQHDTLGYGAYNLNPFLVRVDLVPMLVVNQGEVAVIKSYVGLPTVDTSGAAFKHGSLVKPGHQGIWTETLRTGKYSVNPRCYAPEIVQTAILTLNWAEAVSQAHNLDRNLSQIVAKSREGFVFRLDLQVQIHVPDTQAAKVICMVGSMQNLVNEVLQAAVGNHFRNKIQSMPAVEFIQKREEVQHSAFEHVGSKLKEYEIETRGVYIQDMILPEELVQVLTDREIAHQRVETLEKERQAEETRVGMEAAKGRADQQAELARSEVGIVIAKNQSDAKEAEARGAAAFIRETGKAHAEADRAKALAAAEGYQKQVEAIGRDGTTAVNMVQALAEGHVKVTPEILVSGSENGSLLNGVLALLMKSLNSKNEVTTQALPAPVEPEALKS